MRKQKSLGNNYWRERLSPYVLKETRREIRRIADRYDVSESWVVAKVLADAFHIKKQQDYK